MDDLGDWPEITPHLQFTYNNTPNATTGKRPNKVVLGFTPNDVGTLLATIIEGHSSFDCDRQARPFPERKRIQEGIEKGEPLPSDLKYDLPMKDKAEDGSGQNGIRTVPARTGQVFLKGTEVPALGIYQESESVESDLSRVLSNDEPDPVKCPLTMAAEKRKAGASDAANSPMKGVEGQAQSNRPIAKPQSRKGKRPDSPHPRRHGTVIPNVDDLEVQST